MSGEVRAFARSFPESCPEEPAVLGALQIHLRMQDRFKLSCGVRRKSRSFWVMQVFRCDKVAVFAWILSVAFRNEPTGYRANRNGEKSNTEPGSHLLPRKREYVSMSLSPRPETLRMTRSSRVNCEMRSMRPAMAWADSRAGMMPSVRARSCAASRAAASETAEYSARR